MLSAWKSKSVLGIKRMFVFLLVLCLLLSQMVFAHAWQSDNGDGTFKNPMMYADYPDPSMIRVGDYFYLATSTFVNSPGLVICRSEDMVNWEIIGHCMDTLTGASTYNMEGTIKYSGGCFAPSIAYKDGTFYVAVTMNDGQKTRIYYATDPAGSWKYSELGGSYFDPCLFIDTDGTPYLAYGGAWQNKISMIQLNSSLSATTGAERTILTYNNVEGAHIVKAKGKYYLFNAVPAQKLVCSRASSVWGPYGETITLVNAGKGGHQGGIVDLPDGSYWGYLHKDDGSIGRPTRICPITWQNDWPMFGREGHIGEVEATYTKPIQNKAIKVPQASDEFNGKSLGLQWMWNHNPDNTKWSLTGSSLRLKATTAPDFWSARNSLTQKGQGLISTGTIKIDCSSMLPGDIGGLGMLGDPRGYIAVTGSPRRIIMTEEEVIKATASNITSDVLYLRIEMNFSTNQAKFFWKDDEAKSWQQLGTSITMGFDWQNGTFQGEQYAILNFSPSASTGYMDVDWFRLNDEPGGDTPSAGSKSAFAKIEAESYSSQSGVQAETCTEGGQDVGYIENGDYAVYKDVDFGGGASGFQARVATSTQGGNIEVRLDSIDGPLVGTCPVGTTGGFQSWADVSCKISGASGKHDVYLKFTGGSGYLFNVNWFQFTQSAFSRIEAEGYSSLSSSSIQQADTPDGGKSLAYVENGNYALYGNVDFGTGADVFNAKVAATGSTSIEVRLGSPAGTLIGTLPVASTGGWNVYQEQSCAIEKATGVKDVYLVFKGAVNFDCFSFSEEVKPNPVTLGDLNSDGDINSVDFLLMKKHILELETLADPTCADLDGNGAVNTVDMLLLKQFLLGLITEFPG